MNATGTSALSDLFTPTATGTYRVIATYNGDATYDAVSGICGEQGETVVVTTASTPPPPPPPPPGVAERGTAAISGKIGCQVNPFNVVVCRSADPARGVHR